MPLSACREMKTGPASVFCRARCKPRGPHRSTGACCAALRGLLAALFAHAACAADPCGEVTDFAAGRTPTRELFVAPDGRDDTGNGSHDRPFATIRAAALRATPGTAIRVRPGTYPGGGYIAELAGTAEAPIWIGGLPDAPRPVLSGGGQSLHLVRPKFVVLHDLECRGAASNGINCDDGGDTADPQAARFLVFRRLLIRDIGGSGNQDGLKLSGIRDFVVDQCEITRCGGAGSGSGIDLVGCHRGLIARCDFHELSANAVQVKGGSSEIEIRACRMRAAGARAVNLGGSTGFAFFRPPLSTTTPNAEARRIRVIANEIEGSMAAVAFVGCVECVVAQNTIVTPRNWVLRILQETTSSGGYEFLECGDNRFENNLVYFARGALSTFVNIGPNTRPGTFEFAHNLWYAYDNPAASTPTLPTPEVGGLAGINPLLRNPAAGNYRLRGQSPARGAGRPPGAATGDFSGFCYAQPPSIGAHEYQPPRRGDLNCDGRTDFDDLAGFVLALSSPEGYAAAYPDCEIEAADANGDGAVDFDDLAAFVACLARGC